MAFAQRATTHKERAKGEEIRGLYELLIAVPPSRDGVQRQRADCSKYQGKGKMLTSTRQSLAESTTILQICTLSIWDREYLYETQLFHSNTLLNYPYNLCSRLLCQ